MADEKSKLLNKVSPLIEGQVPDFVQSDHPVFVNFLKQYYQFMEAGQITYTATVNYVTLETTTTAYVLEESAGDRIVTESGSNGSTGKFTNNETITGATSGATATVLVEDSRNGKIFVSSQQKFITGETITGGTSGATGTINEYRANPIQNIQQLLDYADVDNTIYDFLDQMRTSLMTAIPNSLASSVSKRDLIKNIKDLYSAKGTKEGHELFFRILLGEEAEIFYPNIHMLRTSDGDWRTETTLRCTAFQGVTGDEVVNQVITGASSGATATVNNVITFKEGIQSITEFELANIIGTFTDGETITGNSTSRDVDVSFTVSSIVSSTSITNDGILHSDQEVVDLENLGNNEAALIVDGIAKGGVSEVLVDDAGSLYEVGDTLTFTAASTDTDVKSASGFVSMVGGGILQETGTLDDSDITTDTIILENNTNTHMESFSIIVESVTTDTLKGDGETKEFTLTNLNANTDSDITLYVDNIKQSTTDKIGNTVYTLVGQTLTFTDAPAKNDTIYLQGSSTDHIVLDGTDSSSTDAGHQIITEIGLDFEQEDTHSTDTDQIVLEFDTFSAAEAGAIQKVHVSDGGVGYTKLPTVTVSTTTGTDAALLAVTNNIGAIDSVKIKDGGFRYTSTNVPDLTPRAHFVLKDVTGTFAAANTLTTHVGTVKGWDSNTKVLNTTFENVIRVEQEQTGTFQEGIDLEDGTVDNDPTITEGIELEDEQDFDLTEGDSILLEGTRVVTPDSKYVVLKVKAVENPNDSTKKVFTIDGVIQPTLALTQGNTYYFDLSDSSLYNADTSQNHQLKFSITSDGTHGGGSAYTTGVTTSASYIDIGTSDAYIQIVVATGAPNLYYYCVNHSGMGGAIESKEVQTFVADENDNLVLDGSASSIFFLQLEDSLGNGFLREENTTTRAANIILEDNLNPNGNYSVLLETGNQLLKEGTDTVDISESTTFGNHFLLERTTLDGYANQTSDTIGGIFVQDENEKILINRYHEVDLNGRLLLNATDSSGTNAGEHLATENAGRRLVLEGTDSDESNIRDRLTFEDETGDGDIVLDGTDSDSVDAGDNIINESGIDFSNQDVTITDSSGASGTIVKVDIANVTSTVETTSTSIGEYSGIRSLLGEDLNRLQDSYYYQDYSYEVKIGAAFSDYLNELKKSVHPAGFRPFGKVSIASEISVAVTATGAGVAGFDGDDTFSPILGSALETIFEQLIQRRMGAPKYEVGNINDQIIYEDGVIAGDKLVLDSTVPIILLEDNTPIQLEGTDSDSSDERDFISQEEDTGSTTPADVSIVLEDSLQPSGYDYSVAYVVLDSSAAGFADENGKIDLESGALENEFENILLEDGDSIRVEDGFHRTGDSVLYEGNSDVEMGNLGGRMMSENSLTSGGQSDKHLVKHITTKLTTKPSPRITRNLLIYLADTPFGASPNGLQLENSTSGSFNTGLIVLDGHSPLDEGVVPVTLESPVSRIVLNGTDSDSTNAGDALLTEEGDVVVNEETETDTGIKDRVLLERGGILMAESDKYSFPTGYVADENENIILEDYNNDSETISFDEIGSLRFKDILRSEKLILEQGVIEKIDQIILLEDNVDGNSEKNSLVLEGGGRVAFEDGTEQSKLSGAGAIYQDNANAIENVGILLEDFGQIQLDGTDSDSTDAGDYLLEETTKSNRFTLELSGSLISEDCSTSSVVEHLILEGESKGRILYELDSGYAYVTTLDRGDRIKLEQGDGDILLLDGTNSDSTNAGDAVLFETEETINTTIALETTNRIMSEGQIPLENWTLNSRTSPIGGQPIVHSSEIRTRTTGDITLEDGTADNLSYNGQGFLVLNGTDSSSTNAGDNFDLEGATGITI